MRALLTMLWWVLNLQTRHLHATTLLLLRQIILIEDGLRNDLFNPDATIAFTGVYGRDGTSIEAKAKNQAIYAFDTSNA